jgi:hypothetical protein
MITNNLVFATSRGARPYLSLITRSQVLQGKWATQLACSCAFISPGTSWPDLAREPVAALVELIVLPRRGIEGVEELGKPFRSKRAKRRATCCDDGEACLDLGVDETDIVSWV